MLKDSRWISEALAVLEPAAEGLVPGMNVDVDILVDRDDDALQISADAVFMRDGQPTVYRVVGGDASAIPIRLGRSTITTVEVLGGLDERDLVVISPPAELAADGRVDFSREDVAGE